MADAKAVDAQMGVEKGISSLAAGLAGANMIYESAGMMASLLGVSFEAMILDNEMLALNQRAIRGIEVNDETLGFEAIRQAVYGDGHFLEETRPWGRCCVIIITSLANRDNPTMWQESGCQDAWHARHHYAQLKAMPRVLFSS